ncbi:ABC transporter substrate-binding protein [Leptolyngbya sp. PCC 6406]|uniref:ABC transporter substrate-binding protein n=1 Tax=Leptolyngbya sp. PCC 6406 TaxID=1173264 RepID=UPI0002ACA1BE|nr:ABC transporter substrate-binding protein [Leptolyngbya sp. PCC 6406]
MAKRNELPLLVASLLITAILLGGGVLLFKDNIFRSAGNGDENNTITNLNLDGADGSSGTSVLGGGVPINKQNGLKALADGDYLTAKREFEAALREEPNDPEALIYLNNSKIGNSASHTIALIVPGAEDATKLGTTQELMRGAAQAQTEINTSGGINETSLKLLIIDDNDNPETAAVIAANLVTEENVLGVIGHFSSGTTLATTGIYETGQLTLVSPTSTSVDISQAGNYIFRTVSSDRLAASVLAEHALETLNSTKVAIFYNENSNYSKSLKSEFETEFILGYGEIVEVFDISDSSFRATTSIQIAQEEADVLMLALSLDPLDPLIQILASNKGILPMLGSDSLYKYRVLSLGNDNAAGLTVAVPWHILNYEESPFVKESRQLWGEVDVNWRTVTTYDAVITLATGIEVDSTRDGVATALSDPNFQAEGATSVVRFLPNGDRNQPFQLVKVVPGNRSGTGYDFVPVD